MSHSFGWILSSILFSNIRSTCSLNVNDDVLYDMDEFWYNNDLWFSTYNIKLENGHQLYQKCATITESFQEDLQVCLCRYHKNINQNVLKLHECSSNIYSAKINENYDEFEVPTTVADLKQFTFTDRGPIRKSTLETAMTDYIPNGKQLYTEAWNEANTIKRGTGNVYNNIDTKNLAVGLLFLKNEQFQTKIFENTGDRNTQQLLTALKKSMKGRHRNNFWNNNPYPTNVFFYIPNIRSQDVRDFNLESTAAWKKPIRASLSAKEMHEKMQQENAAEQGAQNQMYRLELVGTDFRPTHKKEFHGRYLRNPDKNLYDHFYSLSIPNYNGIGLWNMPEKFIFTHSYLSFETAYRRPLTTPHVPYQPTAVYAKVTNEDFDNRQSCILNTFKTSAIWTKIREWRDWTTPNARDQPWYVRAKNDFGYSDNDLQNDFNDWQTVTADSADQLDKDLYKLLDDWKIAFGEYLFMRLYTKQDFYHTFIRHYADGNHGADIFISVWNSIGKRPDRFDKFREEFAGVETLYHGSPSNVLPGEWNDVKTAYGRDTIVGPVSFTYTRDVAYYYARKGTSVFKISIDKLLTELDDTIRNEIYLIPITGKASFDPSQNEIVIGELPINMMEIDVNH
eukprot:77976_1